MAHGEPLWPRDEDLASDTVELPAETAEEITQPIPPVPGPPPAAADQTTTGLPLLDVIAPEQTAAPDHQPTTAAPLAPPQPPTGPPARTDGTLPTLLRRAPRGVLLAVAAAAVILLAVLGWLLLRQSPAPEAAGRSASTAQATTPAARATTTTTTTPPVRVVAGYQFTQHASRTDTDCAANAYGEVANYLRRTPCTKLDRALYTTNVEGRPAVVSLSTVQMADERAATELQKLADSSGTGNVADLLRAGVRVPGGPDSLTNAGYASLRSGSTVVIAEADFADPGVRDGAALDRLSTAALQLHG